MARTRATSGAGPRPGGRNDGKRRRRWPKVLAAAVLVVLLLPVVLVGGVLLALQTGAGQRLAQSTAEDLVSGLKIGSLDGALPFELVVRDVRMADAEGVWLTLDRGRLAWNPWALFGGAVEVEAVDLEALTVERLPAASEAPAPDPEPSTPRERLVPELPNLGVTVRDLSVARLVLGEPVLGERLELAVDGRLAAGDPQRIETAVNIERLDGEGQVTARAVLEPQAERLEAHLEASSPQGGFASRLAGLPGEPPISVTLDGSGPLEAWQAEWRIAAGDVLNADGTLSVAGLEPPTLRLEGAAEAAALLPPDLRPLALPAVRFALTGSYGDSQARLTIDTLASDALSLSGSAAADLAAETVEADLALSLDDPAALSGLAGGATVQDAEIALQASGPLGAPEIDATARLAQPALPGTIAAERVVLEIQATPGQPQPLPAEVLVDAEVVGIAGQPALTQVAGEDLTLFARGQASGDAVTLDRLSLQAMALSVNGDGTVTFAGPRADLALRLAYPELSRLAGLTGLDLTGGFQGEAYVTLDGGAVGAMVTGSGEGFGLGIPAADALLGDAPDLWLEARRGEDGVLALDSLGLDGAALSLGAEARLDGDEVAAELRAALPRLAALEPAGIPVSGSAEIAAEIAGTTAAPVFEARIEAPQMAVAGTELSAVRVGAQTEGLPPDLSGLLTFAGETPVGAVDFSTGVAVGAERVRLSDLRLARGGDALTGQVSMPLSGPPAEGSLSLRVRDLGAYRGLAGDLRAGRITADVALSAQNGGQAATVEAEARGVRLADGTRLDSAAVEARLGDLFAAPAVSAQARVGGLAASGVALRTATLDANGSLSDLSLALQAEGRTTGDGGQPLALDLQGRLALEEATRLELAALQARYGALRVRSQGPATLAYGETRLSVEGLRIALGEGEDFQPRGTIAASVELAGNRIDADLTVDGMPLAVAEAVGPDIPLTGMLDAAAQVSGSLPRPDGRFRVRTRELRFEDRPEEETQPLDALVEGTLGGGRVQAEARVSGFAEQDLTARAEVPLLIRNDPPGVELPQDEPISLVSDWSGRLGPIVGLLPVDVVRIEGQGELDLSVGGTLADPQASGRILVTDGVYENYTLGTFLKPFRLEVAGEGRRLVVREFRAEDVGGGGMSAEGWVELGGGVPRFEIALQASNLDVARTDDLQVRTDADLRLEGSMEDALLAGSVTTEEIQVSLAGDVPSSVTTLEVTQINTGEPEAPAEEEAEPGAGLAFLSLQVDLTIPGQLFVRGRGLDSEWQGDFRLRGTAADPQLTGSLQPVRGFFDLAGKRFDLETGQIDFTGGFNPTIDLTTVYREDGFTARINVSGSANKPEINLSSEPPLPNDEIIARILFGQGTARLTATQAVMVARAAAQLTGGGTGLIDYARDTLGVDVLNFAPGETEGDLGQVEAGKYLSDDVFVGVRQGTAPGSSSAVVEWEITPNLTLESEVGTGTNETNLGLSWEWDY